MAREVFRYASRRERNQKVRRTVNLVLIFATLWVLLWVVMKRHDMAGYVRTFLY
jgi:hypothetical protein